jgi:hypothetical protein
MLPRLPVLTSLRRRTRTVIAAVQHTLGFSSAEVPLASPTSLVEMHRIDA